MATATPSYFLLSALLLSATTLAAPAAPPPVDACVVPAAATTVADAADIDYAAINDHLTISNSRLRLAGLQDDLQRLGASRAPEIPLLRQRLLVAQAQAQADLGFTADAMATLRRLPIDSPQAPEAILLMAELEISRGQPAAAVRWLRQLAELYPEEAASVRALLRAAEVSDENPPQAYALLQQAVQFADRGLAAAQHWQAQSRQPDFVDQVNSGPLSPALWRLARTALVSADFADASAMQAETRRQLHCLARNSEAQLRQMERHPRLLADLDVTVDTLSAQLETARADVAAHEADFQATAQRLRECTAHAGDCAALKQRHDAQGRELTGWRNRLRTLEGKLDFLRQQEDSMRGAVAAGSAGTAVAGQLGRQLGRSRGFMQERLRQSLADAVQDWEALSASAHYRLAVAQEPSVDPGLVPSPANADAALRATQ